MSPTESRQSVRRSVGEPCVQDAEKQVSKRPCLPEAVCLLRFLRPVSQCAYKDPTYSLGSGARSESILGRKEPWGVGGTGSCYVRVGTMAEWL